MKKEFIVIVSYNCSLILLIRFATDCLRLYVGLTNLMDGEARFYEIEKPNI